MNMKIAEVFGHAVENLSDAAIASRDRKHCPFRNSPCTKSSSMDPLGVCSLSDGVHAAALCPVRLQEGNRIFNDAARLAFGDAASYGVFPEVRILKIETANGNKRNRKIGKVDFIIGKIDGKDVIDFAALEVQTVYFSGSEIRTPMRYFLKNKKLDESNSERRPDFRSSAQKRLIPQLRLKVPVFRRWGKKFFVAVDSQFFDALPAFPHTTPANSEVTWLNYPIDKQGDAYRMKKASIIYSEWDEVQNSMREGQPPEPSEIIDELQSKLKGPEPGRPRVLTVTEM